MHGHTSLHADMHPCKPLVLVGMIAKILEEKLAKNLSRFSLGLESKFLRRKQMKRSWSILRLASYICFYFLS
jgi:hypothetical protein